MLRRLVKSGLAWGLHGAGADAPLGRLIGGGWRPLILGYHRVVEDVASGSEDSLPAMAIGRSMLERHLDWVGRHHRFVSLDELGAAAERGEPFTEPIAAVTFDDGYADVFENAFPLLRRKGVPAAFFVVTDWVGTRDLLVHDRLFLLLEQARARGLRGRLATRAALQRLAISFTDAWPLEAWPTGWPYLVLRRLLESGPQARLLRLAADLETEGGLDESTLSALRPMTWEMLEALRDAGMTVGSHTRTHVLLTKEEPERVKSELALSRATLERRLGTRVEHLAYPDGDADTTTAEAVGAAGYRYAYLACGHRNPAQPLLTQPRLLLWQKSCVGLRGGFAPAILSCQLHGVFPRADGCVRAHSWRTRCVA